MTSPLAWSRTRVYTHLQLENARPHILLGLKGPNAENVGKSTSFYPIFYKLEELQEYCQPHLQTLDTKVGVNNFRILKVGNQLVIRSPLDFYLGPHISKLLGFNIAEGSAEKKESYHKANETFVARQTYRISDPLIPSRFTVIWLIKATLTTTRTLTNISKLLFSINSFPT